MVKNNSPVRAKTSETKIRKVKYIVTSVFSETSRETADQKLLRLVSDKISNEIKGSETGAVFGGAVSQPSAGR